MAILCKINKKYFMTMVFIGNFWLRDLIAVFGLVLWRILIKFADVNNAWKILALMSLARLIPSRKCEIK